MPDMILNCVKVVGLLPQQHADGMLEHMVVGFRRVNARECCVPFQDAFERSRSRLRSTNAVRAETPESAPWLYFGLTRSTRATIVLVESKARS
jgi:hypothetical protein